MEPDEITMDDQPTWDECEAMVRIGQEMRQEGVSADDWDAELARRMEQAGQV